MITMKKHQTYVYLRRNVWYVSRDVGLQQFWEFLGDFDHVLPFSMVIWTIVSLIGRKKN